MKDTVAQAAKGLAKGHVTDNIKGGEVEPVAHVEALARLGKRGELLNEEVDVAADDALLLEQGLLGEGVSESAALATVVVVVGHGERGRAGDVLDGADMDGCVVSPCRRQQIMILK